MRVFGRQTPGRHERDAGESFGASSTDPNVLDGLEEEHTETVPNID